MSQQINEEVTEFLKSSGITYQATGGHEVTRDNWTGDQWRIQFSRSGKADIVTDYTTGIGHRKSKRPMPSELARLGKNIMARVDWEKQNVKPVAPEVCGTLCSILRDAEGAEQNFHDWAGDYGYDNDSLKARNIHDACCALLVQVRSFFTREERTKLMELLEDY